MSFKKYGLVLLLPCVLFLTTSCDKWLNEEPGQPQPIELDKNKTRCLRNWSLVLDNYLLRKSKPAEVADFWNCLDGVLTHFEKHATGETPGIFTIDELVSFYETLFLNKKIPVVLVERIKDFKRAIFSGNRENFNREDLNSLHKVLAELKFGTLHLLPHVGYITLSEVHDGGLEAAITAIDSLADRWRTQLSPIQANYKLRDLLEFWYEMKALLGVKTLAVTDPKWKNLLVLIERLKALFVGLPAAEIAKTDWPVVYHRVADTSKILMLYKYRLKDSDLFLGSSVGATSSVLELAIRALQDTVSRRSEKRVYSEEIMNLYDSLLVNKWIEVSPKISRQSVEIALRNLLRNILRDPSRPAEGGEAFLTSVGLSILYNEVKGWELNQNVINKALRDTRGLPRSTVIGNLNALLTQGGAADFIDAVLAVRNQVQSNPYLTIQNVNSQFIFSMETPAVDWVHLIGLSHLNWMTRVCRLILLGYGSIEGGVSEENFDRFYFDFRELGINLGILDSESKVSGLRTYMEANNFTYLSNGDEKMSLNEAVAELQILFSSGLGARRIPVEDLKGSFEQYLITHFEELFANLPRMITTYQKVNTSQKVDWVRMLVKGARGTFNATDLDLGEVQTILGLMHLAESITLRFDEDRSGYIDAREIRKAFNVFEPILRQAAKAGSDVSSDDMLVGFVYFIKNGEPMVSKSGGWWDWWSKVKTAARYKSTQSDIDNNKVFISRPEVVRTMVGFKDFTKSN